MKLGHVLAGVCLALFASSGITGCSSGKAAPEPAKPISVAVAKVTRQDLTKEIDLSAEFKPYQEVDLHAKVSGYLRSISVDVGDHVKAGQTIALLEVPEMDQDLAQATAALKRTKSEVQRAEGEVARAESNVKIRRISYDRLAAVVKSRPNLVAQQEVDDAAARLSDAEAQLSAAKASLSASQEQVQVASASEARSHTMLSYLRISAPFAGVITQRRGDTGALVQAGTASQTQAMPVVRLSQVNQLRLVLPVPESIAARIRVGTPVEVRVDALRRVFQGHVARCNGRLDTTTRTMETEVDIPNPQYALKPGMFGSASITMERKTNALAIPIQASSGHSGATTLLAVNSHGVVEERRVEVGLETPDMIEILSGVQEGEMVVVGGRNRLKPGMIVQPKLIEASAEGRSH